MKKDSLAEKLAKKSFESAEIQKSWQTHTQIFGPILEPAFVDNYQARIRLTAALNYISNRKIDEGLKKLQSTKKYCVTDADKAAWLFCMGLCMEMANMKEQMVGFYQSAADYNHSFYWPYLKTAKAAHNDGVFEIAEENYLQAINCLESNSSDKPNNVILGSAYTNYASCLTMMHRFEEADNALQLSHEILPEQQGRVATEAILEAAKGNAEKALALTELVSAQTPTIYEATYKTVNDILEKSHPHFNPISINKDAVNTFWGWFVSNETDLLKKLEEKDYDTVFQITQPKLNEIFPFVERDLDLGIEPGEDFYQITFADYFMKSLEHGYKELIAAMPQSLAAHWKFDIAH